MRLNARILWRRGRRTAVLSTLVLLICAILIALVGGRIPREAVAHPADAIRGPRSAPVTVWPSADGKSITCPQGSVPYVNITAAEFTPKLTDGSHFGLGRYRITLSGQVANETTAAIVVDRITPWILHHRPWPAARVGAPLRLAANSSGKLHISGTFRPAPRTQAVLGATLHWHWAAKRLARCGEKGLISDD